jgi:adenine-specific DNA-methyltransferase
LNSKLYYQWLYHRGKRKGEALELYQVPLSEVPIKVIGKEEQQPFIQLVDRILAITTKTDYDPHNPPQEQKKLEREIDQRVYKLYGLTKEEIELVEKSTNF